MEGKLYRVKRPSNNQVYPELGYNEVIVCATNPNQAKGIALNRYDLAERGVVGLAISKKDIIVEEIEDIKIGDVICLS